MTADRWGPHQELMSEANPADDPYVRVTLELRQSTLLWIDRLRTEMGLRNRGTVISHLLDELAAPSEDV
jgi:hypothetical protein